jgi:hypothetical protein
MESDDATYLINNNKLYTLNYIKIFLIIKEYSKITNLYTDKHIISIITTLVRWHNEVIDMPFDFYYDLVTNERPEIIKYVKYQYYNLCNKNVRKNGLMLQYIKCQSFELCLNAYYNNPSSYGFVNKYYFQRSMYMPTIHPQTKDYYDRKSMIYNYNDDDSDDSYDSDDNDSDDDICEKPKEDLCEKPKEYLCVNNDNNKDNNKYNNKDNDKDNNKDNDKKNDLGFALTGFTFIQCQVCKKYCNPSCNQVIHGMCINCTDSNVIEKDLYVLSLNKGLPLTYLSNDIINYGYCHRCGIKDEKIFCDQCINLIKETKK